MDKALIFNYNSITGTTLAFKPFDGRDLIQALVNGKSFKIEMGIALCHKDDRYVKAEGKRIALEKLKEIEIEGFASVYVDKDYVEMATLNMYLVFKRSKSGALHLVNLQTPGRSAQVDITSAFGD